MKKYNFKMILLALGLMVIPVLNMCISIGSVMAATRAVAISPMNQRVVLTPGETYRGSMTVANPNDAAEDLNYLVSVSPYFPTKLNEKDNYTGADLSTKTNMNMIVDWITIDNPTSALKPNSETYVTFSINVPENAPAGGQYAALLVRENPEFAVKDDNSVGVNEIMQMGHIIYAEVAGETVKKGSITENNFPSVLTSSTLEATSMVRNDGNVHTDATYTLQVWPMFSDEEICTNEEDAESSLVMPSTERYHVQTCDLPSVGIFRAKQVVSIFGEQSILEKTIIVCPIWLMILILVVIVAIIVWIIIAVRKHSKKSVKSEY